LVGPPEKGKGEGRGRERKARGVRKGKREEGMRGEAEHPRFSDGLTPLRFSDLDVK